MRAIVIGLGSMGRRRVRLLKRYDASIEIIGIDSLEDRCRLAEKELVIKTGGSIKTVCENSNKPFDIAFVSTSPLSHSYIIKECLEHGMHVFTEINLTDKGYEDNIALAKKKNRVLFMSCTFLYRREVQYIKNEIERSKCQLSYTYHVGQYLPDWHPWENYREFFAADKMTNGCRELMAIELPWLLDAFGDVKSVFSKKSRNTELDIIFPDSYSIVIEHETGHRGMIAIDIVSRKPVRNMEIWGEKLYLTWDGTPTGLFLYDYEKKQDRNISLYDTFIKRSDYSASIIEDAYLSEIENFIEIVMGKSKPKYSFEQDGNIISLIDSIEDDKI